MAIYYLDLTSGNDGTGTGTAAAPWRTHNKAVTTAASGDTIRVAKTAAHTSYAPADTTFTFTDRSTSVTATGNITASVPAGTYIGKSTAAGNGSFETFYRVNTSAYNAGSNLTTLTLARSYYGTTESVSSILLCTYVTDAGQTVGQSRTVTLDKTITIIGGWDISDPDNPVQNGETWFKGQPASRATSWSVYYASAGANTVRYMNLVETYSFSNVPLYSISYCTAHTYIFSINSGYPGSYSGIDHMAMICESNTNGYLNSTATTTTTFDYIYLNIGGHAIYANASTQVYNITNSIIQGATNGINGVSLNCRYNLQGTLFRSCTYGINQSTNNCLVDSGGSEYCSRGVITNGAQICDFYILNFNTTSSTYGISVENSGVYGVVIEGGTSINDSYGVYSSTTYNRGIRVLGRSFTTPTNYGIYVQTVGDTVFVSNCTIDEASASKLVYNPGVALYSTPKYIIQNCSFQTDGQYWGYHTITPTTTTYRTEPPCLQYVARSTVSVQWFPVKLWSTYVESSKSYTVSVYIKSGNGWSGTIVPVIRHNGCKIYTGSTISSLTEDWVLYSYSITSDLIASNGELSFEVVANQNTVNTYYDDFSCVEV